MRHTDAHLVELLVRCLLADLVQQDDDGFTALQGEAFLSDELGLQEGFEDSASFSLSSACMCS